MEKHYALPNDPSKDVMALALNNKGQFKRVTFRRLNKYRSCLKSQTRFRNSIQVERNREDDSVEKICLVDVNKQILFFSSLGKVFTLSGKDLRSTTPAQNPIRIDVLFNLQKNENLIGILDLDNSNDQLGDRNLILCTHKGRIEKLKLDFAKNISALGSQLMSLKKDDRIVAVNIAAKYDDVVIISEMGMAIRFSVNDLPIRNRVTAGVVGIALQADDNAIAMMVGEIDKLGVPINRMGEQHYPYSIGNYPKQSRGGYGTRAVRIRANNQIRDRVLIKDVYSEGDNNVLLDNRYCFSKL